MAVSERKAVEVYHQGIGSKVRLQYEKIEIRHGSNGRS
jgi:ribosomal protein L20A (L18A)